MAEPTSDFNPEAPAGLILIRSTLYARLCRPTTPNHAARLCTAPGVLGC
jgi:hypothetical protein